MVSFWRASILYSRKYEGCMVVFGRLLDIRSMELLLSGTYQERISKKMVAKTN